MTKEERNNKLKHFITCLKCEVSGKCCDDNCSTQYDAGNMGEIIENLEAISKALEQEPRWISVSEKKPDEGGEYLLWGKIDESEEEDYCFIGDYYEFEEKFGTEISNYDPNTLGFIDTEIEEYYSVIAWMPLPKPYSEVEI